MGLGYKNMSDYDKVYKEVENLPFDELNKVLLHQSLLREKLKRPVTVLEALRDYKKTQQMSERKKKLEKELLAQREEILKHKWYLSEKAGRDVGSTFAALDWVKCGYAEQWRNKTGVYAKRS